MWMVNSVTVNSDLVEILLNLFLKYHNSCDLVKVLLNLLLNYQACSMLPREVLSRHSMDGKCHVRT